MNMKAENIQIIVLQIVYKISNFNTKITVTFEEKLVNRMEIYFQMYFSWKENMDWYIRVETRYIFKNIFNWGLLFTTHI